MENHIKLSVVIPHHIGILDADKWLKRCVKSLHGHDEIIIYANDGVGYGAAVNSALELTTGDHIVVTNNDITLLEGSLKNLIVNNAVTVPIIIPEPKDYEPRAFFCMSRNIYQDVLDRYGYFYDERFEVGYWEDDDLIYRLREMGVDRRHITDVRIAHLGGGGNTMKQMGEQHFYDENKGRFDEKWGG